MKSGKPPPLSFQWQLHRLLDFFCCGSGEKLGSKLGCNQLWAFKSHTNDIYIGSSAISGLGSGMLSFHGGGVR